MSEDAHILQIAPSSGAPQLAQKRPSARAPQEEQVVDARADMRTKVLEVLEVLKVRLAGQL